MLALKIKQGQFVTVGEARIDVVRVANTRAMLVVQTAAAAWPELMQVVPGDWIALGPARVRVSITETLQVRLAIDAPREVQVWRSNAKRKGAA